MMAESQSVVVKKPEGGEFEYERYESDPENNSCGVGRIMNQADWMSRMGGEFFSYKVGEVVWPGTHDSGAYCQDFDYEKVVHHDKVRHVATKLFNCLGPTISRVASKWSQTQTMNIKDQLEHGVRYLDLRVSRCLEDDFYYIVHSFCGPSLEDVLSQIVAFMNYYPKECLLLEIDPVSHVDHSQLYSLITRRLDKLLLKRDHGCNSPMGLPLSRLQDNGRIVVLYKEPTPLVHSFWESMPYYWDNKCIHAPFVMSVDPEEKERYQLDKFSHFCCGSHRNQKHEKLFHFMYALTPTLFEIVKGSLWPSAFMADTDPVDLQDCAKKTHTRINDYFGDIKRMIRGCRDVGLIFSVDFVENSVLMGHIISLNESKFELPN